MMLFLRSSTSPTRSTSFDAHHYHSSRSALNRFSMKNNTHNINVYNYSGGYSHSMRLNHSCCSNLNTKTGLTSSFNPIHTQNVLQQSKNSLHHNIYVMLSKYTMHRYSPNTLYNITQRNYSAMSTSHMGEFGNEGSAGPKHEVQSENGLSLLLTENCIEHLKNVFQKPDFKGHFLRLSVEGGEGCQGFSYTFTLESEFNPEEDIVFEYDQVKVVIDSVSGPLLSGSTVDYVDELVGRSFRITKNPNAAQECGCGVSFTPNTFL